jgi:hypothetical protein
VAGPRLIAPPHVAKQPAFQARGRAPTFARGFRATGSPAQALRRLTALRYDGAARLNLSDLAAAAYS